jgi:hypothetical protein
MSGRCCSRPDAKPTPCLKTIHGVCNAVMTATAKCRLLHQCNTCTLAHVGSSDAASSTIAADRQPVVQVEREGAQASSNSLCHKPNPLSLCGNIPATFMWWWRHKHTCWCLAARTFPATVCPAKAKKLSIKPAAANSLKLKRGRGTMIAVLTQHMTYSITGRRPTSKDCQHH